MTKREQEQLERLLAKKQQEEQHDHGFFAEVVYCQAKVRKVVMKIPSFCNRNSSKMSGRDSFRLRCCLSH